MNFRKMSIFDLEAMDLNNKINIKEMTSSEKAEYIKEYSLYRKWFTEYIIKMLNLKEYDEKIKNSGLNLKPNDLKDMDIYQYFSSDDLSYFYIRNNIYLERLSDDEKAFLQAQLRKENFDLDENATEFIEKTYKKVVVENFEDFDNLFGETLYFYGPNTMRFAAPGNALVIGMRYDEFAEDGASDEEWKRQHDEQEMFIYPIFDRMSYQFEKILGMPVSVIKYNQFSVKKRRMKEKDTEEREEI